MKLTIGKLLSKINEAKAAGLVTDKTPVHVDVPLGWYRGKGRKIELSESWGMDCQHVDICELPEENYAALELILSDKDMRKAFKHFGLPMGMA